MRRMTAEVPGPPLSRPRVLADPVRAHLHRERLVHEEAARVLEQRAEEAPEWEAVRLRARAARRRQRATSIHEYLRSTYREGGPRQPAG
jgi:hypothetical protein